MSHPRVLEIDLCYRNQHRWKWSIPNAIWLVLGTTGPDLVPHRTATFWFKFIWDGNLSILTIGGQLKVKLVKSYSHFDSEFIGYSFKSGRSKKSSHLIGWTWLMTHWWVIILGATSAGPKTWKKSKIMNYGGSSNVRFPSTTGRRIIFSEKRHS